MTPVIHRNRRAACILARLLSAISVALLPLSLPLLVRAATVVEQGRAGFRADASPRLRISINETWKYTGEDVEGAEAPSFDDSRWVRINLPHTWNAEDTLDDEPGYRRGVGWYRKTLRLSSSLKGRKLFLYFEGANQVADLFVNGRFIGQHRGGYTAFAFDITDFVQFDSQDGNIIAVKVDNSHNRDIPPLSADFNFYGGVYRNVWLIATAPVHINLLDHASQGVYVDTPMVSEAKATVRVRGTVTNGGGQARQVRVVSTVVDNDGREVAAMESVLSLGAGREASFQHVSRPLLRPHLWSPDHPYLYTVDTRLYVGQHAMDMVESPLGFRWFSLDADRGFFLNGKPLKLRGTNRHQDYRGIGNALPDSMHVHDLEIIKEMGANFVRLAHYPQAPTVLETADRLGLILWEEIPIVDHITTSEAFTRNCENMLTEMIRQHYNHPSVLMWGYMNEVLIKPQKEEGYVGKVVELARRLDQLAHREDAGRATVIALHHSELYNTSGLADVPQAVGWNLYFGWYEGTFPGFGAFLDAQHRRFPKRPIFVSEYGADADRRLHALKSQRFDYTIEWQRLLHESYFSQIEERPFLAGTTLWIAFDFGSESRGESRPHINQKGLLTFDRRPKDVYFFYQAKLSRKPVLHIATRDWPKRTGTGSSQSAGSTRSVLQPVEVYTNLAHVELLVNGQSLGSKAAGALNRALWEVPFREGLNVIEARGLSGGKTVRDRTEVQFIYRAAVLADPSVPFKDLAVNAGSDTQYLDDHGIVWEADQPYSPGGWGYVGGTVEKTARNIIGTTDDRLYQFDRENLTAYRFDVPDGDYEVELRFAEIKFTEAGKRLFNVLINRQPVIEKLDLVREYGPWRAALRKFYTRATRGAGINIEFNGLAGNPMVSAIRVRRLR